MRTYDLSPLFRSTVGFDRLLDTLLDSPRPDWPPYDIERKGENEYRIRMATTGFSPNDIELAQQGTTLIVTGQKKAEPNNHGLFHEGLAFRNFRQTFSLADHVKVTAVNLENGFLSVELVREVPEQLRFRRIEVGTPAAAISGQDNQPKVAEQQNTGWQSKAA
jgi:molecular chaperone IbpA